MASAISDEWTEEKCIHLIREYRKRPILWDPKDAYFFKKTMKPASWEEIAEAIDVSAKACKHKMIILMSSFRREKAKIMHNLLDGKECSEPYRSSWFAFKEMAFLMDKETERKRQLMGINDDDEIQCTEKPIIKKALLKHHNQLAIRKTPTKRTPLAVRKHWAKIIATKLREENKKVQLQPQPTMGRSQIMVANDEIGSFATFIANKMKKYTETTKNAVQRAICDVIFKADQNFYENCENFTFIDDDSNSVDKSEEYDLFSDTAVKIKSESDMSD